MRQMRLSIRFKILLSLLLLVTAVVSLITFTMASMFHADKTAYIHDLASIISMSAAEEVRSVLAGYAERLRVYGRIMERDDVSRQRRTELMKELFADFPDLVAVQLYRESKEIASVYDAKALERAGLTKKELESERREHPIPAEATASGKIVVRNSTLSAGLPVFTMAMEQASGRGKPLVIAAVVHLEPLMGIVRRSSVFRVSLIDSEGVLLADNDIDLVAGRSRPDLPEGMGVTDEGRAGMTIEYEADTVKTIAGVAGADLGGVWAVARIPSSAAYMASRDLLNRFFYLSFVLLVLAALISVVGSLRITRPVERLVEATRRIARGEFDTAIDVRTHDEIGTLADSFQKMAEDLKEREEALKEAQSALVQSEKMAAFGQLGAGIAHEIKNPLAGILGCAQISLRKLEGNPRLHRNLSLIEKETKRCRAIIENLLKFARQEKAVFEPIEINRVVDDAVAIVRHQLELQGVKLERRLAEGLPMVHGNANQLQQVVMNLLMNSGQAMEGHPGEVVVTTSRSGIGRIEIRVADTGPGMTREVRERIFEPFFTTKPGGKGTGLGLSVSFGIIQDHGGEISVRSEPGRGATFLITLKAMPAEAAAGERQVQTV